MNISRTILTMMLSVIAVFVLTMQVNAADETRVAQVFTINTHGNTAAWLKAYKPLNERLNKLNPRSSAHLYEAQFAGTGAGLLDIVVEDPSMAYMEQQRIKNQGDPEVAKLIPALMQTGMTLESRALLLDRAPDQVRKMNSPVQVVYAIDTHGKNDAFVAASKKLHEHIFKVIPNITVRIWEAMFAGQNSGMIYIVVGYPSISGVETLGKQIDNDAESTRLFAERDKLGATIMSRSLHTELTP